MLQKNKTKVPVDYVNETKTDILPDEILSLNNLSLAGTLVVSNISLGVFILFAIYIWFKKNPDGKNKNRSNKIRQSIATFFAWATLSSGAPVQALTTPNTTAQAPIVSTIKDTTNLEEVSSSDKPDETNVSKETDFYRQVYERNAANIDKKVAKEREKYEKKFDAIEKILTGGNSSEALIEDSFNSEDFDSNDFTPLSAKLVSEFTTHLPFNNNNAIITGMVINKSASESTTHFANYNGNAPNSDNLVRNVGFGIERKQVSQVSQQNQVDTKFVRLRSAADEKTPLQIKDKISVEEARTRILSDKEQANEELTLLRF